MLKNSHNPTLLIKIKTVSKWHGCLDRPGNISRMNNSTIFLTFNILSGIKKADVFIMSVINLIKLKFSHVMLISRDHLLIEIPTKRRKCGTLFLVKMDCY